MSGVALAAATGCAVGFLGAIPPGPASLAIAGHAADGRARDALLVGLGAVAVDVSLTLAIALGAGPLLAQLVAPPVVRVFLAAAYAGLGALLLAEMLLRGAKRARRPSRPARGFFAGVLRGVTNPSLVANWTLAVAGLTAAGALPRGNACAVCFALAVGAGVLSWFALLTRAISRAPSGRVDPWLRVAGVVTGAILVVGGGLGALRTLVG